MKIVEANVEQWGDDDSLAIKFDSGEKIRVITQSDDMKVQVAGQKELENICRAAASLRGIEDSSELLGLEIAVVFNWAGKIAKYSFPDQHGSAWPSNDNAKAMAVA